MLQENCQKEIVCDVGGIATNKIRDYFKRFHAEVLTAVDKNKELIEDFTAPEKGKKLAEYLREDGWKNDKEGETRVYLVKDDDGKVASFFSLKCGLLYGNPQYDGLHGDKKEFVDMVTEAYAKDAQTDIENYYATAVYSQNEMDRLFKIAESRAKSKKEIKGIEEGHAKTLNVEKCYSAIEIQHFCRNDKYEYVNDKIPLGFGIFWEVIVPLIIHITNRLGCKYIYLFAADNTENKIENQVKKLVQYYTNDLKFSNIEDMVIIRPEYDEDCFPMCQEVALLKKNWDSIWEEFSDVI